MPTARFPAIHVALAVILLGALGVRLWGIGAQSLWHDEVLTTLSATAPLSSFVGAVTTHENTPPLYFFLMNLWVRVAGLSDVALRLPSVLLGVACVLVIYKLGKTLFGPVEGLMAALFLAVARYHIAYSQEARTYSLTFLLLLLSCWFLIRMVRHGATADQVGYTASAALAMYAHPFSAFALAAQNLFYFAVLLIGPKPATGLRRWLILQAAIAIAFWPWLHNTWRVVEVGQPWIVRSTPFHEALLSYAGSPLLLLLLAPLVAVALAFGMIRRERGILLMLLLVVLPVAGPLAFSTVRYQTFVPRYGIIALAGLLMLGAYGAARLRPWATGLIAVAYVVVSIANFRPGYGNYPGAEPKPDVRAAARHVAAHAGSGDAVMIAGQPLFALPLQHYLRDHALRILRGAETPDPAQFPRLWVLYGLPEGARAPAAPVGYMLVDRLGFDGVVLYQFAATSTGAQPEPDPATARLKA